MTDRVMDPDDFEDEQLIQYTQGKRKHVVESLMKVTEKNPSGLPYDEGSRIMLMQSLDGLSSVALKRKSLRQKERANEDQNSLLKGLAGEFIRGMVGASGKSKRNTAVPTLDSHKQEYVEGELSTDQAVVDEQHIIDARKKFIQD